MKLLSLETSTKMGSIAITDNTQLLGEFQIAIKDSFSETLLPAIDHLLKSTKISIHDVDAFVLAQGPGSFTSLRIGMSVVKGLALKNKTPIIPIPTLDGLAHNLSYSSLLVCPLIDARKGEVYTAFYKKQADHFLAKLTDDRVVTPERLIDEIDEDIPDDEEGSGPVYEDAVFTSPGIYDQLSYPVGIGFCTVPSPPVR